MQLACCARVGVWHKASPLGLVAAIISKEVACPWGLPPVIATARAGWCCSWTGYICMCICAAGQLLPHVAASTPLASLHTWMGCALCGYLPLWVAPVQAHAQCCNVGLLTHMLACCQHPSHTHMSDGVLYGCGWIYCRTEGHARPCQVVEGRGCTGAAASRRPDVALWWISFNTQVLTPRVCIWWSRHAMADS